MRYMRCNSYMSHFFCAKCIVAKCEVLYKVKMKGNKILDNKGI